VVFGALAGGFLTVIAGSEPGLLLGLFVIIATAVGTSAVRPTAAYLTIPVPALAYFVVALIAGLIHDRGVDTSRAILFVNAVQWSADGFLWMFLATVIAIAIAVGRWLMSGRAGYRGRGAWLARLSGAWAAPEATGHGTGSEAARAQTARPSTARPASARPQVRPEHAESQDAAAEPPGADLSASDRRSPDATRTRPIGDATRDTEHSSEA
jgi:hypothetical protein